MNSVLTRRDLLKASAVTTLAGLHPLFRNLQAASHMKHEKTRIPLIHTTDLYHPPQDPDDHIDLATVMALDEFDLKGVVLDMTQKFLDAAPKGFDVERDPGFVPVSQLSYLTGRTIPVASGPPSPLSSPEDSALDRPKEEQAGIQLILDILEDSTNPVAISVVGSARVITAAYNRNPSLLRSKVKCIVLNAGSTGGPKREWNVNLDPAAYIGLWRSGLPICWYPCATERGAFNPEHEHGTYWKASHAEMFRNIGPPLRPWIVFGFTGNKRGDIVRAMNEEVLDSEWQTILTGSRNMWSTGSLVMAAGRVLARTPAGWRFVHATAADGLEIWPWRLDPINARVDDDANVQWQRTEGDSHLQIFWRKKDPQFAHTMVESLNALLASLASR